MGVDQDVNNSMDYALRQALALVRDNVISWRLEKKDVEKDMM